MSVTIAPNMTGVLTTVTTMLTTIRIDMETKRLPDMYPPHYDAVGDMGLRMIDTKYHFWKAVRRL